MGDKNNSGVRQQLAHTTFQPFSERVMSSAQEHGARGRFRGVLYGFRFLINFYLNLAAMFAPYSGIRVLLHRARGVHIGKHVLLGFNVNIDNVFPGLVTIKDGAALSGNNSITAHSKPPHLFKDHMEAYAAPVVIEKNVWVAVGATILAGVTIGEGSVISAGAVVTRDVPPWSLMAGNPARLVRRLKNDNDEALCVERG